MNLILAFKRLMRTGVYPVSLLLCVLLLLAASMTGQPETLPTACVCDSDGTALSRDAVKILAENDFLLCQSEEELYRLIRSGACTCGVILPPGFGEKIRTDDVSELVTFVETPETFAPQLYRNHIAAAVFHLRAPYIAAGVVCDTPITADDLLEEYQTLTEDGMRFTIRINGETPENVQARPASEPYLYGAAALCVFAVLLYGSGILFDRSTMGVLHRIGPEKTMTALILPGIAVQIGALLFTEAVAAVVLSAVGAAVSRVFFYALALYILAIEALVLLLRTIFSHSTWIYGVAFCIMLLSFLLLPVYFDLAVFFPVVGRVRMLLPTSWLWTLGTNHIADCAALLACPAVFAVVFCGLHRRQRS